MRHVLAFVAVTLFLVAAATPLHAQDIPTASASVWNSPDQVVDPGQTVKVLAFRVNCSLPRVVEQIDVRALAEPLDHPGVPTGDESTDILSFTLVEDVDQNGEWDPLVDETIMETTFPENDGALVLPGGDVPVNQGQSARFLLVAGFSMLAEQGAHFAFEVTNISFDNNAGFLWEQDAPPIGKYTTTTINPDFASVVLTTAGEQPHADVTDNQTDALAGVFIAAASQPVTLETLRVQRTSGNPAHVTELRLLLDADADGQLDGGDVLLDVATVPWGGGDELTLAVGTGLTMAVDEQVQFLIVADFGSPLPVGMKYAFDMIDGTAADDQPVVGPAASAVLTATPLLEPHLAVALLNGGGMSAPAGSTGALVADIRIDAVDVALALQAVRVQAVGSCNDVADITALRMWRDANDNGQVDTDADTMLAVATFNADNAIIDLAVDQLLGNGSRTRLLATADLSPDVPTGRTFGLTFQSLVYQVSGSVEIAGLPVTTPALTVGVVDDDDDDLAPIELPGSITSGTNGCQASPARTTTVWLLALTTVALAAVRCRRIG